MTAPTAPVLTSCRHCLEPIRRVPAFMAKAALYRICGTCFKREDIKSRAHQRQGPTQ